MGDWYEPVDLDRVVAECAARYLGSGAECGEPTTELAAQLRALGARNPALAHSVVSQLARSIDAALGGAFHDHLDQLYAIALRALGLDGLAGVPLGGGYGSPPVRVSDLEEWARLEAARRQAS